MSEGHGMQPSGVWALKPLADMSQAEFRDWQALLRLLRQLDQLQYGPPSELADSPRFQRDQVRQGREIARQLESLCKAHRAATPQS